MRAKLWAGAGYGLCGVGAVAASMLVAPGLAGILGGGLAVVMIAIAIVDARHFIIPDWLVLAGALLGFAAAVTPFGDVAASLIAAAVRATVVAAVLWSFRALYRRIRQHEGLGLGDVKLAAVAGVWLDWMPVAIAIDVAALSALAVVLIRSLRGERISGKTAIPFGLFFAPAIWIAWLYQAMALRFGP